MVYAEATLAAQAIKSHGSLTVEIAGWMVKGKLGRDGQNIKKNKQNWENKSGF